MPIKVCRYNYNFIIGVKYTQVTQVQEEYFVEKNKISFSRDQLFLIQKIEILILFMIVFHTAKGKLNN